MPPHSCNALEGQSDLASCCMGRFAKSSSHPLLTSHWSVINNRLMFPCVVSVRQWRPELSTSHKPKLSRLEAHNTFDSAPQPPPASKHTSAFFRWFALHEESSSVPTVNSSFVTRVASVDGDQLLSHHRVSETSNATKSITDMVLTKFALLNRRIKRPFKRSHRHAYGAHSSHSRYG